MRELKAILPASLYKKNEINLTNRWVLFPSLPLTFCELPPFNHESHTQHLVNRHE